MQQLSVIGVEDGVLVLEAADGGRFTVPVSELPELRGARATVGETPQRHLSPREVQALIRGGLSVEDVAGQSGDDIEYVRRFEGPVAAERSHMLELALAVPVRSGDIDPLRHETSFGAAIGERLDELAATGRSWSAWKPHDSGWVVGLTFTTESMEHEARWSFEPRKSTLTPIGREATALSRSGDASSVLVPRLRAVDAEAAEEQVDDEADAPEPAADRPARFDSGAFRVERDESDVQQPASVEELAISRAPAAATEPNHTADLLEALRRRRGEREAALQAAELAEVEEPADEPTLFSDEPEESRPASPLHPRPRRDRAAMPSWDEIVFGSKGDDRS